MGIVVGGPGRRNFYKNENESNKIQKAYDRPEACSQYRDRCHSDCLHSSC